MPIPKNKVELIRPEGKSGVRVKQDIEQQEKQIHPYYTFDFWLKEVSQEDFKDNDLTPCEAVFVFWAISFPVYMKYVLTQSPDLASLLTCKEYKGFMECWLWKREYQNIDMSANILAARYNYINKAKTDVGDARSHECISPRYRLRNISAIKVQNEDARSFHRDHELNHRTVLEHINNYNNTHMRRSQGSVCRAITHMTSETDSKYKGSQILVTQIKENRSMN